MSKKCSAGHDRSARLRFALKLALAIHHQRVVGHRLLRPRGVLRQVAAALLLHDVEKPRRAVVGYHLRAVVVEQPMQAVEMPVPHAVRRGLEHQGAVPGAGAGAQHRQGPPVAVRPIAEVPRRERERLLLAGFLRQRQAQRVRRQHQVRVRVHQRKQRRIAAPAVGDGDGVVQLHGVEPLLADGVVHRKEPSAVGELNGGADGFAQDSIAVREDLPLRLVALDGLGETPRTA